jgi:hypothetical protein
MVFLIGILIFNKFFLQKILLKMRTIFYQRNYNTRRNSVRSVLNLLQTNSCVIANAFYIHIRKLT